ncbi:MAG: PilZ domain-containing protein [Magnetococcus sp. MYC-9]
MDNQPITTPNDLYEALLQLLVRAREGELPHELIQILFNAVEKVTALSRREESAVSGGEGQNRQHFRLVTNSRGTLILAGERLPVVIHDVSPQGFGVHCPVSVRPNTTVLLEAPASAGGMDIFSCFVSYSKKGEKAFFVGLRIVDMLPRF